MSNTQPNIIGDVRRIHASLPLAEVAKGVSVSLSSHEGALAQIDLVNPQVRRHFGHRVLEVTMIDQSGFAELRGEPTAESQIKIRLGHSAIIGRDCFDLPLLNSEIISENHLALTYTRVNSVDSLDIHDYGSTNGSHVITNLEQTWAERLAEVTIENPVIEHAASISEDADYEWLYVR